MSFGQAAMAGEVVRMVVAFPAGGPADALARAISRQLETELKHTVIIDNRPGANGAIAVSAVTKGPVDGSVFFLTSAGAIVINPSLYKNLAYRPERDLMPVSLVVTTPQVLVVPVQSKIGSAKDLVAQSRAGRPVSLASSGIGSMPHMAIELFKASTSAEFLHVAYKGAAPAITDTIGGQVDAFFGDASGLVPFIEGKKLKPVAVTTAKRLPYLPDVPTLDESGIQGVHAENWYGMMVPAGTPPKVVQKLNEAIRKTLEDKDVKANLAKMGLMPAPSTAAEFAGRIRADRDKWSKLIADRNVKPE
ncbi:Bug family tripartite tricarboxylate transporter substrate binding protein [Cupriavidus necator]|uniref:Bug family tripartite tricarboxylate transporter substrate binding protein n=1 Tax=Cupriavidus necator TaxID=106590 RepID=UPI002789B481|nr:tripartite tricarboxylate transporter substrate binding protein [Cupriavidus necator]MDQ0141297.1 tripartite-type tricarboxylate transporter receptor subunit TctC [Cupriavidus necator]